MTNKQKPITEEQLKKELKQNKTIREVAREYGYSTDSNALSKKKGKLDLKKNYSLSARNDGYGFDLFIKGKKIREALERKGLLDADEVFYSYEITKKGNILIKPTESMWREE